VAAINTALNGLSYAPTANYSGTDTLTIRADDLGHTGSANQTATTQVAIAVNPVADTPTLTVADATPMAIAGEFRVNSFTSNAQINPSVAALPDGGFVVTWESQNQGSDGGYGIYGQRYDASGNAVGAEFHVNTYTTSEQEVPAVVGLSGGGFVVMWASYQQDGSDWGVYGQVYGANGSPVGSEFHANAYLPAYQSTPALAALAGGGFVATWMSYGQDGNGAAVIAQRFDAGGNKVGTESQVNTFVNSEQYNPAIAAADDGSFVITWQSFSQTGNNTHDIYGQRFNADGTRAGSEFPVNITIAGNQTDPAVALLSDGSFVITWQSPDASGNGIFARHFAANGIAIGGEFAVNAYALGEQSTPSVVALPNGGFLISWMSYGQDGSGNGVFGQAFDAAGQRVGNYFRISQSTSGDQEVAGQVGGVPVAVLTSGNIVQVWDGAPQISGNEIYARLLATPASGTEDHSVQLPAIMAALNDNDGSETLVLHLTGFPAGATFSVGALDGSSGHWLISGASQIASLATTPLTMNPPADFNGNFTLHVAGVVTDTAAGVGTDTTTLTRDISVSIAAVNDAPTLMGAGNTVGYTEQATPAVLDNAIVVGDIDNATLASASATISSGFQSGDTLTINGATDGNLVNGTNTIHYHYDSATHAMALSGSDTLAGYQAALRLVSFSNATNDDPTAHGAAPSRTITWATNDGQVSSPTATTTINVSAVNDAPVVTPNNSLVVSGAIAGDNVTLATPLTALSGNSFSWEARVRLTAADGSQNMFMGDPAPSTTNHSLQIGYRDTGAFTFAFWNNDLDYANPSYAADMNTFVTWAGTYDAISGTRNLYRNGVLVASDNAHLGGNGGNYQGPGALVIGGVDNFDFNGGIDYVRVFSRTLSAAEVSAHANGTPVTD
ncbi:MAG: uncharacterized protein JWQ07_5124, partial [Ramlibacter sp.]|nr:uncharacterized protein [Ramlibacter sp.]